MLRLPRHTSARLARALREPRETAPKELGAVVRSSLLGRRDLVSSAPHAAPSSSASGAYTDTRWLTANRRRAVGLRADPRDFEWNPMGALVMQRRGLASGGGGGKGAKEEGMFDRLKKTFEEEVNKNPALKENLAKLKEAEKKLRENPSVRENLAKLREAEERFKDNPAVKERLSNLKDAEKKFREEAKDKQGDFMEQAAKARERAEKSGSVLQDKFQEFKKMLDEKMGKAGGASGGAGGDGKGKDDAENEFVRASREKFSGAQKAIDDNSVFAKLKARTQALRESVSGATAELFVPEDKEAESAVVKKLKQPKKRKKKKSSEKKGEAVDGKEGKGGEEEEDEEDEEEEDKGGIRSLMIVKTAGEAWERLQERLKEAPIIQELLGASRVVASGSLGKGAKAAKDTVKDKVEDVQEAWETSQHPLVYKISSAWDTMTAESDEGIGVRELRRLDPSFSVEDWKKDIQDLFLPEFMSAFLRGDVDLLQQWTGEACFNKLASEAKQRKADGMVLDPHVLDVRQGEVIAIKADAGKANPTIAFQFMCQQINCVRNTKGEIIEGAEDDIRATYYILAFQREFNDDEAELRWKVVDMMVVGAFPWY